MFVFSTLAEAAKATRAERLADSTHSVEKLVTRNGHTKGYWFDKTGNVLGFTTADGDIYTFDRPWSYRSLKR